MRGYRDDRTRFEQDRLTLLEQTGADFGALEILKDADGPAFTMSGAADSLDVVGMIFVSAVEKLSRAMSIPRRSSSRMAASVPQAGPMVQMILARRWVEADTRSAADGCVCFNLSPGTNRIVGRLQQCL